MVRKIKIKNASIYAEIEGKKIDVEIRTSKDSAHWLALFIEGKKIVSFDYKDGKFIDEEYPCKKPMLRLGKGVSI